MNGATGDLPELKPTQTAVSWSIEGRSRKMILNVILPLYSEEPMPAALSLGLYPEIRENVVKWQQFRMGRS